MASELFDRIAKIKSEYGKSIEEQINTSDQTKYPQADEPAMIHPLTTSTIKLRSNGMIDIFVATDNGLRIDPTTKTINIIGTIYQQFVTNINTNVEKDILTDVGNKWTLKAGGTVRVESPRVEVASEDLFLKGTGNAWLEGGKINIKGESIEINGPMTADSIKATLIESDSMKSNIASVNGSLTVSGIATYNGSEIVTTATDRY